MNCFIPSNKFISALSMSALCALSLAACGGGDSSTGSSPRVVAGTWTGALTRTTDNCPGSTAPQTVNFSHVVNQNVGAVTLTTSNGQTYIGNVVGEDGFSVDGATQGTYGGTQCQQASRLEYNTIVDDDDEAAEVELGIVPACTNSNGCRVEYTGTASRVVSPSSTPTPTASGTPNPSGTPTTPIAGGCAAINPNPAADSYAGNGGCGISEVVYRVNGSTVVLEPFGANGASSFAISSANTSTAASARSDLSIKGETGNSCSLTCSAPSTFTLSCFKEGGTSCVEKF